MHPTDKAARVAGAIYLSMVVSDPFSLIYIPSTLIVRGNATATANNILAHEMLFQSQRERRLTDATEHSFSSVAGNRHDCPFRSAVASIVTGGDPNRITTSIQIVVPTSGSKHSCD